jgi:hypothetical protein
MKCTRDHSDPNSIPEFLCRLCHPELVRSEQHEKVLLAIEAVNDNPRGVKHAELPSDK